MNSQIQSGSAVRFWASWLVLTVVAFSLSTYFSILLRQVLVLGTTSTVPPASVMYMALTPVDFWGPTTILSISFLSVLMQYSLLGFAQWLVLRRFIDLSATWILATAIGAALARPPLDLARSIGLSSQPAWFQGESLWVMNVTWLFIFGIAASAFLISFFQWRLLRRHLDRAHLWILASVVIGVAVFLITTRGNIPHTEWRQTMILGPLTSVFSVPTVTRMAYSIPSVLSQGIAQALLGVVMLILLVPRRAKSALSAAPA